MIKRGMTLICLSVFLLSQSALAESADYHLKRLEIQARAFLSQLDQTVNVEQQATVEEQLESTADSPTWAENMVIEDIHSLLSTTETLRKQLAGGDTQEYLNAKIELESLARRLRISTSPLQLNPQQTAGLELMMLELDESTAMLSNQREQLLAREDASRRSRSRVNVGVGIGTGWGSPWGYNNWGYGGWGPFYGGGFYRPFPRVYRRYGRICR